MTIEKRLENLENLVNALSKKIDNNKYYTDADINGNRKSVSDITPYTESKTAYIDDEYVTFDIAKDGNISVYMVDGDGQNVPCEFEQINGQIKVSFEKRNSLATVTISIQ
jgi:Tol biopolymer transport system component